SSHINSISSRCNSDAGYRLVVCPEILDAAAVQSDALKLADLLVGLQHCFLNMAKVASLDSTGVGYLLRLKKQLRSVGCELILIGPNDAVRAALKLMRIEEFFCSAPDLATAQHLLRFRTRENLTPVTPRTAAAVTPLVWHGEITAVNANQVWENT